MKALIIGTLTFGTTVSASAMMKELNVTLDEQLSAVQENDEESYFEKIGDLYKAGNRPDLSKISNIAWPGRCFNKIDKMTNAGYIFRKKRINGEAGPISNDSLSYEASTYWALNKPADYFDKLHLEEVYALNLHGTFETARTLTTSVEVRLNSTTKSNLRHSGTYLVEEVSGTSEDVGPLGQSFTGVRCYYFIPDLSNT